MSGQAMNLKLEFNASLLDAQHQKGQRGEQADKCTCCAVGKGTKRYSYI